MEELSFAKRLLERRSQLGLSQEDVAKILGVTSQTISNWEAGTVPRKARIAQVEAWIANGAASTPAPVDLGPPLRDVVVELPTPDAQKLRMARIRERAEARDSERATFAADLPAPLRQYANPLFTPYKHFKFQRDYLSPHVSAFMVFPTDPSASFDNAVLDAAAIRAIDEIGSERRMFNVVIVVGAGPETKAREITLTAIADLVGVGLHFVPDASAAAAVVTELEGIAELL